MPVSHAQGNVITRIEYVGNLVIKLGDYYQMAHKLKVSKTDGVETVKMSREQSLAVAMHDETLYGVHGVSISKFNVMSVVGAVQQQMLALPVYTLSGRTFMRQVRDAPVALMTD